MAEMASTVFLITGAAGYLGRRLVAAAEPHGPVFAAVHGPVPGSAEERVVAIDVTDRDAVLRAFRKVRPAVVIHAAAINPGQGDDDLMWRVNADGSRHVAAASRAVGARLIAISTDLVHDGRGAPYDDDHPPKPVNAYGRSKAAGEVAVRTVDPGAVVVRTSLMYGLDEMDRGTASFAERIARREPQILFTDVLRNPINVDTLADAVVRVAATDYVGTLNVAGRQALSRAAFGRRMLRYWQVPVGDLLQSGLAADVSESIPLDLRLSVDRAEELLGISLLGVDDVMRAAPSVG